MKPGTRVRHGARVGYVIAPIEPGWVSVVADGDANRHWHYPPDEIEQLEAAP